MTTPTIITVDGVEYAPVTDLPQVDITVWHGDDELGNPLCPTCSGCGCEPNERNMMNERLTLDDLERLAHRRRGQRGRQPVPGRDRPAARAARRGRLMDVLSLFSGAGGLDRGLEDAGHTIVAQCEIDKHAASILRHHWPDTYLHDDMTTFDPEEFRGRVDLVAGGSPCQDLSVAGRRGGLDGARSGLFWHQCRIADSAAAPWVLWENVAGALSSNDGADFASVLWGLTGALPGVPDGGWRTAGVVVGPRRTAVWRLFDARWFGVAQRRRRVFVVAGPRELCGPEILLEPEGLRGDSEPSRAAGTAVAALTARCVGTCGADDNQAQAGHLVPDYANTLTARDGKGAPTRIDAGQGNLIPVAFDPTLITSPENRSNPQPGDPCHTLPAHGAPPAVAAAQLGERDGTIDDEVHHTLRSGTSQSTGVLTPDLAVRRLTPRECERLMGWPDDHTRWGVTDAGDVVEIADSHRYRACGNGVVSPVAEWIGRRLP